MEYLYVQADEILPGDILPDVSRFVVASVDVYPSEVYLTFEGTSWTHSPKPFSYGDKVRYAAFRVERAS